MDGWNAWFQSDRKRLAEWKCDNRQSLGQLWIGFLSFYAGGETSDKSVKKNSDCGYGSAFWEPPWIQIQELKVPYSYNKAFYQKTL